MAKPKTSKKTSKVFVSVGVVGDSLDFTFTVSDHHQNALLIASQHYKETGRADAFLVGVLSEAEFEKIYETFKVYKTTPPHK